MPASSAHQSLSGNIDTWAGIALDNIAIFNALALGNRDAIETEAHTLDTCLSHSSPQGVLHYHSLGACATTSALRSTTVVPALCDNNYNTCLSAPYTWATNYAFPNTANHGGDFGLARDGHVIKGPYNSNGELWDCSELDMCNGTFIDDGSYVYAPTAKFPHVVGCWGPAPHTNYRPNTACTAYACDAGATALVSVGAALALAIASVMN